MTRTMQRKGRFGGKVGARGVALVFAVLIGACGVAFTLIFYVSGLILG
jgi:hypothetical protein